MIIILKRAYVCMIVYYHTWLLAVACAQCSPFMVIYIWKIYRLVFVIKFFIVHDK